jgi:uncharacterized protein (TIGR00369 family)
MDPAQVHAFLDEIAPGTTRGFVIESIGERTARIRMLFGPDRLNPGGVVGGPHLMTLADTAVWVAVLGVVGPEPTTVTVSLTIHFLRRVPPGDVIAETRLHKVGSRLATGDVLMYADGDPEPVAHATVTYAMPSESR